MSKTTNRKHICIDLAKQSGLFITHKGLIKLSIVDKDYFALSEAEILARFDKWSDCLFFLKGYLTAKNQAKI
jgi:hypothetical protein